MKGITIAENKVLNLTYNESVDLQITVEKNIVATIILNQNQAEDENIDILVKKNAHLTMICIGAAQKTIRNAAIEQDGHITWVECLLEKASVETTSKLQEPHASSQYYGMALGTQSDEYELNTRSIHKASNTTSDMKTNIILNDNAQTSYKGLIQIDPHAENCSGYQKEQTIVLSKAAKINAVPILEIHNDNVKCSHGTAIGKINKEKLFYLMARGIDKKSATHMLLMSFFEPILDNITDESIHNHIRQEIEAKL